MGTLADIFDVVRDHVTEAKESLADLCDPFREDLGYIWDELTHVGERDDDEDD